MDSPLLARLGQAFRKRREALGFSQESFADHIGMHRTYYSAIVDAHLKLTRAARLKLTHPL